MKDRWPDDWTGYLRRDYSFVEFAPGAFVLDVGCGRGTQLRQLEGQGYKAVGIDRDRSVLAHCEARVVLQASAEEIPIGRERVEGVICKVVLPYTDEARAVAEIGRILRPCGVGRLSYHGAGYYLRYLVLGPTWRRRFYAVRTFINTWCYVLWGCRLHGFLGDTMYQSRRRLRKYYRRGGLTLLEDARAPSFLRWPVFIYHTIQKVGHAEGGRPESDRVKA